MNGLTPIVLLIASVVCYFVMAIGARKMFKKAGEAGWKAAIPILNLYFLFKIAYGKGWKFVFLFVPILNVVATIACSIRLAQVYGKGVGFGILIVLFQPIMFCVLGYGHAAYSGPVDSFF